MGAQGNRSGERPHLPILLVMFYAFVVESIARLRANTGRAAQMV